MTRLEANIFRALAAYKVEQGMSSVDANAWALANLAQGLTQWKVARGKNSSQDLLLHRSAYIALKSWARAAP